MSKAHDSPQFDRRALVAAGAAGVLGFGLLHLYERRLVNEISGGPPVSVVVATRDLSRGTELTRDVLGVRSVPESYVESRQIREERIAEIVGGKLGILLKAGEALQWTDLEGAKDRDRQLSDLVEPGTRALAVRASTFGGLIRPGDRVDVLERAGEAVRPAIQNLIVLAVGGSIDGSDTSSGSETITLGGSPGDIAQLTRVEASGSVALALRNSTDTVRLSSDPVPGTNRRWVAPETAVIEHVQ